MTPEALAKAARAKRSPEAGLISLRRLPLPKQRALVATLDDQTKADWSERVGQNPYQWDLLYPAVRAILLPTPSSDAFAHGIVCCLNRYNDPPLKRGMSLAAKLRKLPELLADDVWRLFRIGSAHGISLAGNYEDWASVFIELERSGDLERARLLDSSLEALGYDFSKHEAGWFSRLHEALKPTEAERARRRGAYLELLASPNPPTVSFALGALKATPLGRADAAETVQRLESALRGAKGAVQLALGLLARAAEAAPDAAGSVARAAALALQHDDTAVQSSAWKLIAKLGDASDAALRTSIEGARGSLAASLKQAVGEWLGSPVAPPRAKPAKRATPTAPATLAAPRLAAAPALDAARALRPIADLEDLCNRASALLASDGASADGSELELLLDGLARLHALDTPARALLGPPLAKLASERIQSKFSAQPFTGASPIADLCGLIDVWLSGRVVPAKPERAPVVCSVFAMIRRAKTDAQRKGRGLHEDSRALLASFSARAHAVARAMALKKSCTPLATPTHLGGWIEPRALVQRLNLATKVDNVDLAQALLRVATEDRPRAVAKLEPSAPHAELVRYALGGKASAPKGPLAACARVAREGRPSVEYALAVAKRRYENRNVGGFRDEFKTVEVTATTPKDLRGSLVETLLDTAQALDGFRDYEATTPTLVASMWPGNLPAVYARGARLVADDFDEGRHRQHAAFVELLRSDHEPMGRAAVLLLGVALASPSADVRSLAVEALAVGITSRRFDPEREGGTALHTLGELLALDVLVTKRWQKAFTDVAGRSALHRAVVRSLVTAWLESGQAAHLGKDLGNVLDLVYEGAVEDGTAIDAPVALQFLASLSGSDLAAKAAKRILALAAAASAKPSKPAATPPARTTRPRTEKPREAPVRKAASKPGASGRNGTTPRRFELVDGKSKKFWSIARSREKLALEWGRLGTKGQALEKHFDTEAEAQLEYDKLVSEKTKKGYLEV